MDDTSRRKLLQLARDALIAHLAGRPLPDLSPQPTALPNTSEIRPSETSRDSEPASPGHLGHDQVDESQGGQAPATIYGGVFVTLRNHGRLRGCIGEFRSGCRLEEAVRRMGVAVLRDPRFARYPVTLAEVPDLSIEISVLSPMERTEAPELLTPGVHGIYVRRGGYVGCFLPQVATEQGWDARELLANCCSHKAGLDENAWKDGATEVYLFTADVLEEH